MTLSKALKRNNEIRRQYFEMREMSKHDIQWGNWNTLKVTFNYLIKSFFHRWHIDFVVNVEMAKSLKTEWIWFERNTMNILSFALTFFLSSFLSHFVMSAWKSGSMWLHALNRCVVDACFGWLIIVNRIHELFHCISHCHSQQRTNLKIKMGFTMKRKRWENGSFRIETKRKQCETTIECEIYFLLWYSHTKANTLSVNITWSSHRLVWFLNS